MNYLFKNGGLASKLRRAAKIKAPLRVQFLLTFGGRGARAGTLLSKGRGRCPWESAKLSVFLILMARLRCCQMSPISQSTFQSQKIPCVNHSAFDAVFLEWPHTHTFTDIHIFHYFCLYQQYFKYSIDIGPQWMWKQFPNKLCINVFFEYTICIRGKSNELNWFNCSTKRNNCSMVLK